MTALLGGGEGEQYLHWKRFKQCTVFLIVKIDL